LSSMDNSYTSHINFNEECNLFTHPWCEVSLSHRMGDKGRKGILISDTSNCVLLLVIMYSKRFYHNG